MIDPLIFVLTLVFILAMGFIATKMPLHETNLGENNAIMVN
jgi:hypothetical protein